MHAPRILSLRLPRRVKRTENSANLCASRVAAKIKFVAAGIATRALTRRRPRKIEKSGNKEAEGVIRCGEISDDSRAQFLDVAGDLNPLCRQQWQHALNSRPQNHAACRIDMNFGRSRGAPFRLTFHECKIIAWISLHLEPSENWLNSQICLENRASSA